MTLGGWYELRVTGSAGTSAGLATGTGEGIAIGENGRICSLSSGCARRFLSKELALNYLSKLKVSGEYEFEPVFCADAADAPEHNTIPAG